MKTWVLKLLVLFTALVLAGAMLLLAFAFAVFGLYQVGVAHLGAIPTAFLLALVFLALPLCFIATVGMALYSGEPERPTAQQDDGAALGDGWRELIFNHPLEAVIVALGLGWFFEDLPDAAKAELKRRIDDLAQQGS
ncbi:hypothetical protein [Acanthopleuribacter pedis]|uniref:Uncharacterized protein n=1 Tax=Acanthopleuribacter pedis TaxID=442870 RepID=A0A8J7U5R6_9BACT|nr:hypothetical protein [Acanthopleuribacter pedis]MBO1321134.1 hypothetical protein [Acanthopleuribacter pedis]